MRPSDARLVAHGRGELYRLLERRRAGVEVELPERELAEGQQAPRPQLFVCLGRGGEGPLTPLPPLCEVTVEPEEQAEVRAQPEAVHGVAVVEPGLDREPHVRVLEVEPVVPSRPFVGHVLGHRSAARSSIHARWRALESAS